MSAIVLAQLAALKTTSTADLKALWRKTERDRAAAL